MHRILFAGDVSWDMSFLTPAIPGPDEKVHADGYLEGPGGVACNAAVAAARAGAESCFLGAAGTDALSGTAAAALAAAGVAPILARREGSICRVVTMIEPHGEKRLLLYPGISLYPAEEDLALIGWDGIGHVHTAIYGPAARALIAEARRRGAGWSLDLEPSTFSGGIDSLGYAIDGAAMLFVNDRAAALIGGDAVARLLGMGRWRRRRRTARPRRPLRRIRRWCISPPARPGGPRARSMSMPPCAIMSGPAAKRWGWHPAGSIGARRIPAG